MGQTIIYTCDNCEDKISGEPQHGVSWNDWIPNIMPVPIHNHKIFCSFNCLANFIKAEHERRLEYERKG